jgi:hypothetical protein
MSARLVRQAARGFIVELLVRPSWLEQRRATAEQRAAAMGTMAHHSRRDGSRRQARTWASLWCGVVTCGWPVAGNLAGVTMQATRGGKIWGKRKLTGGPRLSATTSSNGLAHMWRWAGVGAELGRPRRKRPTMIFFHFKFFSN